MEAIDSVRNETLIKELREKGVLRSPRIADALRAVPRGFFVPAEVRHRAYDDDALPIGHGQTISQPYTVVFMLELLAAEKGNIVLEAGYGSGWQTALLAYLVGTEGHVYAYDIVPALCASGARHLARFPALCARVTTHCRSATPGVPEMAGRIDRIIAAAEMPAVPDTWREQLKTSGILVYPSAQSLWRERKTAGDTFEKEEFPGFAFVPYIV